MKQLLRSWALKILWWRARKLLEHDQPEIIAVTGSVGKTTTREAIWHLLSGVGLNVRRGEGNMNTEFSLPLAIGGQTKVPRGAWQWLEAILELIFTGTGRKGEKKEILVLEFASEKAGDIAFLAARVPLDIVVFTRFALSHAGPTLAAVTEEKLSILAGLKKAGQEGTVVVNADDEEQKSLRTDRRSLTYGGGSATVAYGHVEQTTRGTAATFTYKKESARVQTELLGIHQLSSLAAALAVGVSKGKSLKELARVAETFVAPPGRLKLIAGRKQSILLDDSYNSSPAAALEALKTLKVIGKGRRRVAILGNMNALGEQTVREHIRLGQEVVEQGVDYLIAVGPNAKRIIRGAREAGLADQHLIDFLKPERLIPRLDGLIQAKDVVLIKASQDGMFFERVVKALMAHPKEAAKLLVRQDY